MEDKQKICDLLCKTLQATSNAWDVVSITYQVDDDSDTQTAIVEFQSGGKRYINVSWDSGTALIRDIMEHLGC